MPGRMHLLARLGYEHRSVLLLLHYHVHRILHDSFPLFPGTSSLPRIRDASSSLVLLAPAPY